MSAELISKVDAMFRRLRRFGYISDNLNVTDLLQNAMKIYFIKCECLSVVYIIYTPCP